MKKLILSLLAIGLISMQAQTPAPPSIPTPSPGPLGAINGDPVVVYHWVIPIALIQSFAGTTGSITLFTTIGSGPTLVKDIIIGPSTAVTGGSLSAVTAQVQGTSTYGSTKDVHTASGNTLTNLTSTLEPAGTVIKLNLASTGGNLSTATAGQVDVWIQRTELK